MISYKWISLTVGLLFIPQLIRSESALTACTNASNCGLTSDSYCVASGQYLKQVSGGTCATVESLTKDDYLIFKKPSTGNIYTKEDQITATDTYVVYQAGDQGTKGMVSQIKSMTMLVGDKLLVCGEGGECKAESELGLYFAESELKPVTCGEEGCAVEEVPGVFYLNEKVYQCKVSGTSITCDEVEFKDLSPEERRKREDAAEEAKLSKDESGNIIITKGDSTEIVIEITDEETKYAVFDEDLSKGLIDDQNATFIKRTKTYAIRVQPEVGYYLNGGSEVDGITNALLYCSTKSDVSKCAAVETVAEGYYAIAGVTGEESIYLQCEEEAVAEGGGDARKREDGGGSEAKANACKEVKEKEFNTCGSSKDIPTCDQIKNPEAVCREGAVEGEVCFLEGRFYESGKDTCQEMKDQDRRSSFIYFNDRHKRVLPQSPLTPDPVIYQCTVVELTSLDNCKLSGNQVTETAKCQKGDNTTLDYCKKGSVVYRTVGETCVVAEEGELYDCKKNEHTLPTCPKKQNNSADCMDEGYCIHTDNKLYVKTNGVCGAVNLGASDVDAIWYFDKQFNRIKYDDIKSNTVIYTRYKFKNYESDTWEKVEAAGVGEMIRVYPHSIEMCLGPEETIPLLATEQSYHEISGAFAGLESATYNIKSIGNGIIKITTGTEAALPECASEESGGGVGNRKREEPEAEAIQCTEGGGYCRDSTTGYIAVKSGQKCALITHTEASTTAVKYFDKDEKIPTAIEPDTITKAYTCEFNEAKEGDGCLLLKGYFTNDDASKVITCNGVEGDTCVVTEISTCTGNGDGGIGKDGSGNVSLCIGSEALPLPETAGFYAYKATNDNFIYGVKKGEFVLLRVGANYAAVVETYKTAAEQIYYINSLHPDISKNVNSEPLVKCSFAAAVDAEERRKRADQPPEEEEVEEVFKNNDGCIGIPAGGTSYDEPVKYYLDYTDPKNIVKCTFSGKCEKVVVMTDEFTTGTKYFVNGEGTAGTIIECDSAAESGECSINSKVEADSIFIDGDNDKAIITCIDNSVPDEDDADNARRKREDGDQAAGGSVLCSSEEIIGVKSNGKTEINAVIIQCTGSKACEEVTTATSTAITYEDGVFSFNDGTASRRRKRDEAPAADEGAVESGYDILSDSDANGLLGINQKSLVLFTSKVVTKVAVNAGYYPRPMTGLENAMIKCTGTSDSTCEIVEKVTPGYYVFGGDGQSYIECTENCVITPVVYTSCENEEELPSCGSDEGTGEQRKRDDEEGPTCITNAPINSVCINDGALFKVVAGEAGCKSFGEEAGKTYHFDENYMELTGDYDPSLVKYTYTCSIETNDRRKREGESVSCIVSKQKIGGIIKTSGTVITPSKTLPNCDGAATSATEICKTSVFDGTDDNINGVHCIDNTGVIYKNSVKNSGTEKSCAVAVGTESETEYLAFDVDGRRIDEVTGESANLVASTYLCTVDGDKAVSGCVLNGNQLPRCDVGGTEEEAAEGGEARRKREEEADAPEVPVEINSRCYANAPVNSVCVTTDGKLMVTESANSCVGLVGLKETIHNFGSDFNEITDPAKSNSIKYSYFCESGGDAETGLSALDKCTPVHPSKGGVGLADVSPILKFCRSAEDSESLPMVATSNQYLSVTLSNAEDFPGAADTGIEVKIGMDGSITELPVENKEAIPKCDAEESENRKREEKDNSCKSGESTVNYCVDASGIINETVDKACQKIKGAKGQKLLSYYKIGEEDALEKVTNVSDETTDIAYAYECEFEAGEANDTETDAKTCEQIKGYKVMDSTSAIYCNGKKDKACVVHDLSTCQAGNVGVLGKSGSNVAVCFGTTGEKLPGEDKTKTIAFYTSEYSDMYGKYGVILLELTATTVKSTETSEAKALKNALIYCKSANVKECEVVDAMNGYYYSSISQNVIACSASKGCELMPLEHRSCGFKDLLPACKVDGPITDDVCSKEVTDTYCIGSDQVIYKNVVAGGGSKSCVALTTTDTQASTAKFYFNTNGQIVASPAQSQKTYYKCSASFGTISNCVAEHEPLKECPSGVVGESPCYTGAAANTVCINSNNVLLQTSGGKCVAVTGTANSLLYFDANGVKKDIGKSNDVAGIAYTYRCKKAGSGGAVSQCTQEYQKAGGIVVMGSAAGDIKMCASEDDNDAVKLSDTSSLYKIVGVKSFPGITTDSTVKVKRTDKASIFEVKELASLPTCSNNKETNDPCVAGSVKVNYCINGNVIYATQEGKCLKVNGGVNGDGFFFFNKDGEAANPDSGGSVSYTYQCVFDGTGKASSCRLVKGFVKTTEKIVNCNGWKGDDCKVDTINTSSNNCSGIGEGGINKDGNSICFGTDKVLLPKDGKIYAAFTTSEEINNLYGVQKDDAIIFLELTANSVMVSSYGGEDEIILLDQKNKANDDDKTPLIKCIAGGQCQSIKSGTKDKITGTGQGAEDKEKGLAHTYYIDGAYPYGDRIITCTHIWKNEQGTVVADSQNKRGKCVSAVAGLNYYVDSAVPGNLISCTEESSTAAYGNLPVCTEGVGVKKCIAGATDGTHCTRGGLLYETVTPASANGNKRCVFSITCQSTVSPFGIYFAGTAAVENEKIIRCGRYGDDGQITCQYYEDVNTDSACVNQNEAANNGKIGFKTNNFKICDNKVAKDLNSATQGYVLMTESEAKTVFIGATGSMFVENGGQWMVERPLDDGYYINVGSDSEDLPIIQCSKQAGCSKVPVDDVHCEGVHTKLPACTDIQGKNKCLADADNDSYCVRDGKLYKTINEENEKCREVKTYEACGDDLTSGACVSGASDGAVCLKGGKLYITYNSKCISVSDLSACTNTTGDAVCVENAQDNDLCRIGDEIYRSGSSTCSKVTSVIDRSTTSLTFYFSTDKKKIESMANGNSESIASVYKCTHKNGNLYGCGKSVRQAGELIYTQTANRAGRLFEVCMGDGDHQGISPVGYRTIPISKVNAFPGASQPGSTAVHFGKNHVRLIRERTLLPECDVSSGSRGCRAYGLEVSHCMMEDMLYETHGTACNKLVGQATALTYLFFDGNGVIRRESEIDLRTDIAFIYQCSLSPNDNSCKPLRGFLKVNGLLVNCNGWSSTCTLTTLNPNDHSCVDGGEGSVTGDGASVCFGEAEDRRLDLPATGVRYVMFKAEEANALYGMNRGDVVLLALNARSVMVVTGGEEVTAGYHQNYCVTGTLREALIYCAKAESLESCQVMDGRNGFFVNRDDDASSLPVIRCEKYLGCRKQAVDKTSCTSLGGTVIKGVKVCRDGGASTLTSPTQTTYEKVSGIDAAFPGAIEENESYVKVGKDGSVTLMDQGYYLNEAVRGNTNDALWYCTTPTYKTTCTRTSASYGYYRNAAAATALDTFLVCDVNGCTGMGVDTLAECTVNTIGQLVGSANQPTLCLDYDTDLEEKVDVLMQGTAAQHNRYMVGYQAQNIFGIPSKDTYGYVSVTLDTVTLRTSDTDRLTYVYTLNSYQESTDCPSDEKTLNEFRLVNDTEPGIYALNCVDGEEKDNLCPNSKVVASDDANDTE